MKGKEIWKDILGYEGKYMVSNWGRVKSLNYNRTGKERILKAGDNGNGYLEVILFKDGKGKHYKIHRLVAQAFLENTKGYTEVNHRDENKQNNCVENLEWCSRSYNNNYGTGNKKRAEKSTNNPKISKAVIGINKISGLKMEFPSTREASRQLGIANSNICSCLKGRQKSAGGYVWHYAEQ